MKQTIEYDARCGSCKGTGLYIGLCERDGAAVVCHSCGGKGWNHHVLTYDDDTDDDTRWRPRTDVKRVFETAAGICIGISKDGEYALEDFGGMPYSDWADSKTFPPRSEMRNFTCPAWWYQAADYKRKPKWDECVIIGSFSGCPYFGTKELCWKRWDKENAGVIE